MTTRTRQRRARGSGAAFQRADGMWVARVDVPRERDAPRRVKKFVGKERATVEAKLDAWLAENRPDAPAPDAPLPVPMDRKRNLARARAIATHTPEEWAAKRRAAEGQCFYCRRWVGPTGGQPDHVVPIGRGGSDGIDNLVLACPECNAAKAATPADEFIAWAERTGFFTAPRRWERA